MGFLSGKKKTNPDQAIVDIKNAMNRLTLRIRRADTLIAEEKAQAKNAYMNGDKEMAKSYLRMAYDLERRRSRYYQQYINLERTLMTIEEAREQEVLVRAITAANEALEAASRVLSEAEIQKQMVQLSDGIEQVSMTEEILAEELGVTSPALETDEKIDRMFESWDAEMLLEKERVLPPLREDTRTSVRETSTTESEDSLIEERLSELEREARKKKEGLKEESD